MKKPPILVIGKTLPLVDRSSQGIRLFSLLEKLAEDFHVDFISINHVMKKKRAFKTHNLFFAIRDGNFNADKFLFLDDIYAEKLSAIGVNVLTSSKHKNLCVRPTNDFFIEKYLQAKQYHSVFLESFALADQYLGDCRKYQPSAKLIVDSVELQFEKLRLQALYLEKETPFLFNAKHKRLGAPDFQKILDHQNYQSHVCKNEIKLYKKCDIILVNSGQEKAALSEYIPAQKIYIIPKSPPTAKNAKNSPHSAKRKNLLFFGDFDQNRNISAALHVKHSIGAALAEKQIHLLLVFLGNNPPKLLRSMNKYGPYRENIKIFGGKRNLRALEEMTLCSLAPISFQNSPPFKVLFSLAMGIPVITNPRGAALLGLTHGENCLIAHGANEFSDHIHALKTEPALWEKISTGSQKFIHNYQKQAGNLSLFYKKFLLNALESTTPIKIVAPTQTKKIRALNLPAIDTVKTSNKKPQVSIVLVTFNQWKFTELCLKSIALSQKHHPKISLEIIVVDNASTDETMERLQKIPAIKLICNEKNLGFAAGVNIGIKNASGENIVILNNDTVVPKDWLAQFLYYANSIENIGLIGPSSNTEALQAIPAPRYNSLTDFYEYAEQEKNHYRGAWDLLPKISGLCMFIPRSTINKVGLLSEEYGIGYFEDDDYCLRVRNAGLKLVWAKDIYLHHFGSMSFEGNRMSKNKYLRSAMQTFIFTWGKAGLDHIEETQNGHLLADKKDRKSFF